MFIVGMELNVRHVKEKGSAAVMISHASIIVPFILGAGLSLFLYRGLAPPGTSFSAFALFIGVAMSITAFPVLARILEDRDLTQTDLGSIALTCAAVDDVTAWCILALVIAIVQASGIAVSLVTLVFTLLFAAAMIFLMRPQLRRMVKQATGSHVHTRRLIAGVLAFVLISALVTETIGIHALFGAFIAGVVMPPSADFRTFLRDKLDAFSAAALLPLVLCVYRFTNADQVIERLAELGALRCHYPSGDCRQARRQHVDEPLDRDELVAIVFDWRVDEHARIGRTGRAEYRLRSWYSFGPHLCNDGIDGAGHNFHDRTVALAGQHSSKRNHLKENCNGEKTIDGVCCNYGFVDTRIGRQPNQTSAAPGTWIARAASACPAT